MTVILSLHLFWGPDSVFSFLLHLYPKESVASQSFKHHGKYKIAHALIYSFVILFTEGFLPGTGKNPEKSEMSEAELLPSRNSQPRGIRQTRKQINYKAT